MARKWKAAAVYSAAAIRGLFEMAEIGNYLAVEPLIIARLEERVSGLRNVSGWSDYASIEDAKMPTPCAYVLYLGDRPLDDAGRGAVQRVMQLWGVVIAVRNLRSAPTGAGVRDEAGPYITAVIGALMGWRPSPTFRPMRRLAGGPPPSYGDLVGYFPLLFGTELQTTGAQQP